MDKAFVEKVTRMVIDVVQELNENTTSFEHSAVKIWPHESPLPHPIVQSSAKVVQPKNTQQLIQIRPYLKK